MEYAILTENTTQKLADLVWRFIANGWIPQGGIAIHPTFLAQAMIKKDDQK